jgi:hypothetical protein
MAIVIRVVREKNLIFTLKVVLFKMVMIRTGLQLALKRA